MARSWDSGVNNLKVHTAWCEMYNCSQSSDTAKTNRRTLVGFSYLPKYVYASSPISIVMGQIQRSLLVSLMLADATTFGSPPAFGTACSKSLLMTGSNLAAVTTITSVTTRAVRKHVDGRKLTIGSLPGSSTVRLALVLLNERLMHH